MPANSRWDLIRRLRVNEVHLVVLVHHSKTKTDSPSNTSTILSFGITKFFGRFRPLSGYQYSRKQPKYVKRQSNQITDLDTAPAG